MANSRFLPLLLILPACTDSYDFEPDPGYGELGVGVFLYECAGNSDPYCSDGAGTADAFPRAIAVGGRIHLRYDWRAEDSEHFGDPLPQLQTAAPSLLARDGDGFTALVPGITAVLAVTGNNEIVDLRHLRIHEIDTLQIVPAEGSAAGGLISLDLAPGEEVELQALALDRDTVTLAGVLGYTWTSDDPEVAAIVAGGTGSRVRIAGVAPGQTTLNVVQGEHLMQVTLHVIAEDASSSSTAADSESSGDTGDTDDTGSTGGDTDASSSGGDTDGDTGTSGDTSGSTGGVL